MCAHWIGQECIPWLIFGWDSLWTWEPALKLYKTLSEGTSFHAGVNRRKKKLFQTKNTSTCDNFQTKMQNHLYVRCSVVVYIQFSERMNQKSETQINLMFSKSQPNSCQMCNRIWFADRTENKNPTTSIHFNLFLHFIFIVIFAQILINRISRLMSTILFCCFFFNH